MGRRSNRVPKPLPVPERTFVETRNRAPDDLDPNLHWLLIGTSPRGERRAREGLEAAGCKVFMPSMHRVITWHYGRRKLEHDVPTFPGWLFAAGVPFRQRSMDHVEDDRRTVVTTNGRPIGDIREIDGIQAVASNNGRWVRVPPAAIRAVADWQNCLAPPPPPMRFAAGSRIKIVGGPFAGFYATAIEAVGFEDAFVDVLVEIFGRSSVVNMGNSQLDAA